MSNTNDALGLSYACYLMSVETVSAVIAELSAIGRSPFHGALPLYSRYQ